MTWKGTSPTRTRGSKWMKIRARILTRDPICVECKRLGTVTRDSISTIVDHIRSLADGGTDADNNLQGLCADHHLAKTQAESARAQGRAYQPKAPRPRIAVDGWPEGTP